MPGDIEQTEDHRSQKRDQVSDVKKLAEKGITQANDHVLLFFGFDQPA